MPVRPSASFAVGADEPERLAATVARLLAPSFARWFDLRFTRSDRLFDAYVSRLTLAVVREIDLEGVLSEPGTAEEIVRRAGLDPGCAVVPVDWMLRRLAGCGAVAMEPDPAGSRFRVERPFPVFEAAAVRADQERHDPAALPSYALAEAAARAYPAFVTGKQSGEQLLLAPARLALWKSYFSNDHSLYAVNNRSGAVALAASLRAGRNTILELGAGMGSGTAAALETLTETERLGQVTSYRVTELVPTFLRYAQRAIEARFPRLPGLAFGLLDMNRPFAEQGVPPGTVSIVYAVNTLHVAHDLAVTLGQIREALEPGGQLVVSECIRPMAGQTLYPELVFNMLATFRARGFFTPQQWSAALADAGFSDIRMQPDIARIRDELPSFCVGTIAATRAA